LACKSPTEIDSTGATSSGIELNSLISELEEMYDTDQAYNSTIEEYAKGIERNV